MSLKEIPLKYPQEGAKHLEGTNNQGHIQDRLVLKIEILCIFVTTDEGISVSVVGTEPNSRIIFGRSPRYSTSKYYQVTNTYSPPLSRIE